MVCDTHNRIRGILMTLALLVAFGSSPLLAQDLIIYGVEKLNNAINTDQYDETSPVLAVDDKYLFFTRTGSPDFRRQLVQNGADQSLVLTPGSYLKELRSIYSHLGQEDVEDPIASVFNQDIWVSPRSVDGFVTTAHPGPPLNNALPNSTVSIGPGDTSIIIINEFYEDGSMYPGFSIVDQYGIDSFAFPRPLHMYDFYNNSDDVNLTMAPEYGVMILSLARDDALGQNDLYLSFHIREDLWTAPTRIKSNINTEFQESTPFISRDWQRLYFSSDRPGAVGGTDIWVSQRLDYTWQNWSEPIRLPEPINSEADDSHACMSKEETHLYFSSRRDGTSDVFVALLEAPPVLPEPLNIVCHIIDGVTKKPVRGEVLFGPANLEGYLDYFQTYSGVFETTFTEPEVYKFLARKRGYEPTTLMFDALLASKQELDVYHVYLTVYPKEKALADEQIELDPTLSDELREMEVGQTISFHNIYFERTTANVLANSHKALNELAEGLEDNPEIRIRVEGHTDNVGNDQDLMELSWQRAEAIKVYLVAAGIEDERIETVGFGPERPISDNSTENGRTRNRRVEVRVVSR